MAVYFQFPILWIVHTSFKTETEASLYPPRIFPAEWRWQNFADSWRAQEFNVYLGNSLTVTILHTLGLLASSSMAAYDFARFNFKVKYILFMVMLMTMMIPWDVTMIPQYMEFNLFGWINTLKPLIVPGFLGSAYYIFLLRQFMSGVPKGLEEAAKIDGAGQFTIFTRIFLPLLSPALILVGILNVITVWNDYLGPLIFLQDRRKYTLALGLASFKGVHETRVVPLMCITIIMITLPVLLFLVTQKHVMDQKSGALK
jgi:multiple sugar transport system permease protein